jgi:hypothetical protein
MGVLVEEKENRNEGNHDVLVDNTKDVGFELTNLDIDIVDCKRDIDDNSTLIRGSGK